MTLVVGAARGAGRAHLRHTHRFYEEVWLQSRPTPPEVTWGYRGARNMGFGDGLTADNSMEYARISGQSISGRGESALKMERPPRKRSRPL